VAFILDDCYPGQIGGCEWSIGYLWLRSDWFARAAVSLLALMAANTVIIACDRLYRYRMANTQSQFFLRDATAALRDGRFDEVIAIAARNTRSPTASVVAEGIRAFASVPRQFTDREAVDAAERAMQRAHAMFAAELARGLGTLRTIASSAPFVGLGGTCFGILNAFRGIAMQKAAAMAMIASFIADALLMTAVGLFVGILAVWLHNYLWRRVEIFRSEMLQAEANILDALKSHLEWRCEREHTAGKTNWGFLTAEVPSWEVSYDRQRPLFLAIWSCGIFLTILLLRAC